MIIVMVTVAILLSTKNINLSCTTRKMPSWIYKVDPQLNYRMCSFTLSTWSKAISLMGSAPCQYPIMCKSIAFVWFDKITRINTYDSISAYVLLSDTEERLQKPLDKVYQWSLKWKIKFNAKQSNILHIRQCHMTRTNFSFKLGNMVLTMVVQYKYLGIVITEFIDYNVVAQILVNAANRTLGSVINKYQKNNGFGYYTYTKLYMTKLYCYDRMRMV